ncbi:hypothetical protein [Actinosynnema sp. NPDC020468]|uniref:hypothetical protein n=1 Tax=Actinosynnema sp. NPDC020468 TaxID=3154488 RepID=UPI0033DA7F67
MIGQWWLWAVSAPVLVSAVRGVVSVGKLAIALRGTKGAERERALRAYARVAAEER